VQVRIAELEGPAAGRFGHWRDQLDTLRRESLRNRIDAARSRSNTVSRSLMVPAFTGPTAAMWQALVNPTLGGASPTAHED
jgi:hypothetical protein